MFGLLLHRYLNDPTICLNIVESTLSSSMHSSSFELVSDGFDTELQLFISNLSNNSPNSSSFELVSDGYDSFFTTKSLNIYPKFS